MIGGYDITLYYRFTTKQIVDTFRKTWPDLTYVAEYSEIVASEDLFVYRTKEDQDTWEREGAVTSVEDYMIYATWDPFRFGETDFVVSKADSESCRMVMGLMNRKTPQPSGQARNEFLAMATADDRKAYIASLIEGYCRHCMNPSQGYCGCNNDD